MSTLAARHRSSNGEDWLRAKLLDSDLLRQACLSDGTWLPATAATIDVINPASGACIARVPRFGAAETEAAIDAAQRAFATWSREPAQHRAAVLRRWADLMLAHQNDLATLLTAEQGKPLAEAAGEIAYAAAYLEWFGEEAKRSYGEITPSPWPDRRLLTLRQPIGVCAAITPWNFPSAMITRKVGPALAAGCTVVLKPAGKTPLSALALAVLSQRAGVPPGVFNVVTGDTSAIGRTLTASPVVRKLSFTGSTAVGKVLMRECADTVKKLSLELGGNAAFIVFDDADLDAAVQGAIASKFRNTGQTCVCTNRFLVQRGVHDLFVEKLAAATSRLAVGDGFALGVQQGPLVDAAALAKVEQHVADAAAKGAQIVTGGQRHALGGLFYEPTVLQGVGPGMMVLDEETFGPLAPVQRFDSEEQALVIANASPFGLASYFYSRDVGRVMRMVEGLEVGMVGVNTGLISTEVAPFGGIKESGLGREGSRHGLDEYTELKYACIGGL